MEPEGDDAKPAGAPVQTPVEDAAALAVPAPPPIHFAADYRVNPAKAGSHAPEVMPPFEAGSTGPGLLSCRRGIGVAALILQLEQLEVDAPGGEQLLVRA